MMNMRRRNIERYWHYLLYQLPAIPSGLRLGLVTPSSERVREDAPYCNGNDRPLNSFHVTFVNTSPILPSITGCRAKLVALTDRLLD